jgi:hypothetical protein
MGIYIVLGNKRLYWLFVYFSIYPSAEQENHTGGMPVPITNNTGSLPDLTVLHFPPPLTTPLDAEDQNYGAQPPTNLSPTSAHHVGMVPQQSASPQAQSPAQRRRPHQGGPSPLVLSSSPSQQMRLPHSPPVSVSSQECLLVVYCAFSSFRCLLKLLSSTEMRHYEPHVWVFVVSFLFRSCCMYYSVLIVICP